MEVLGVDLSTNMIDIGKQRAKEFEDDKVLMSDGFAGLICLSPNFDACSMLVLVYTTFLVVKN